ncbi:protein kinase domain-containing protein [Kistimonas asteriae]|uniref:protein kinase domain-containing protein n=1 Tax=Kistimonas asteriae TaxID=517724 RepID=UPI001BAD8E84|nr:protein kinase [Kistimonas asteriae]
MVTFHFSDSDTPSGASNGESSGERSLDSFDIDVACGDENAIKEAILHFSDYQKKPEPADTALQKIDYEMQAIGTGHFANILLYRHLSATEHSDHEQSETFSCAFKFAKEAWEENQINNELKLLREIHDHKNIVKLCASFRHNLQTVLVLERCQHSLQDLLDMDHGSLTEHQVRVIGRDIARALTYLEEKHIAHCDLKPANVLEYKKNCWKVCDLGLSQTKGTRSPEYKGTLEYMAPEAMKQLLYSCHSDWFAFGILLMELAIHPTKIKDLFPITYQSHELCELLSLQNDEENKAFMEETLQDYMSNLKTQKPDQRTIDDILKSTPKALNLAYVAHISILIKEISISWQEEFLILAFAELQDKTTDRLHPKHIARYQQNALERMYQENRDAQPYRRCVPQCCSIQ